MYIYGYIDKNVINEDDAIDGIVNPYRRDVIAGSCTEFCSNDKVKMARGIPITPQDRHEIVAICRANGWTEPPVYDAYYDEYQFW